MCADPVEGAPPYTPNVLHPMDIDPVECPQPDIFDHAEINGDRRNLLQVSISVSSDKSTEFASTTATLPMIPEELKTQKRGSTGLDGKNKKKRTNSVDSQDALPRKVSKPDRDADLHEAMSFRRGLPIVKLTLWSRIQNRRFHSGEFLQSSERDHKFRDKILKIDPRSKPINPKTVLHFKCGKEYQMKEPYNTANFRLHHQKCKGTPKSHKLPAGGMKKIDLFFAKASKTPSRSSQSSSSNSITFPCPGLRESSYSQVEAYLERSGARGGGGPSVSSLAAELFGKKYRKLSLSRQRQVKTAQRHEWLWRNDHQEGVVYSTACTKEVQRTSSADPEELPCESCSNLLNLKAFKNIVHKPRPTDKNYRHVNNEYRNDRLASLFGRCSGLREIIEVSIACRFTFHRLTSFARTSPTVH